MIFNFPLRRFKMEAGFQINMLLVLLSKLLLAMVLFKGAVVQGEPGVDFILTQSGINGFVNDTIRSALNEITDGLPAVKTLSLSERERYLTLWNMKISDVQLQTPVVTMTPGKGIKIDINQTSFVMACDWVYERRVKHKYHENGSVSTALKGLNVSLFVKVQDIGKPSIKVTACKALIGQFLPDIKKNSLLNRVTKGLLTAGLKNDFERAVCEEVSKSVDDVIQNKLEFLTPFKYGSLLLECNLNKQVVTTHNSILAYLNGRFNGDSYKLKDIKMDVPVDGMIGVAISEEVIGSALRVWQKEKQAEFSIVRDTRDLDFLPDDWLKVDGPVLFKVFTHDFPNVSISTNGITISLHGSLDLRFVNPKPGSNQSMNITFSVSLFFDVSLTFDHLSLKVNFKDFDFKVLSSPDPEFDLKEFEELIDLFRESHLNQVREEFVFLIRLFDMAYLKTAKITLQNKFLQMSGELAHF